MNVKAKLFLAKLLIVFSIILIIWGTVLQFSDRAVLHPVDDVTILAGIDKEIISITSVDADDLIVPIVEDIPIVNPSSEAVPPIDNSSNNDNNSVNSIPDNNTANDNNSGGSSENYSGNTEVQAPVEVVPSIEETNMQLRNSIQNTYGVVIKYGNETNGYNVGGMTTIGIPDAATCQAALVKLNNELSLYPSGFFSEIKSKGYPLTFYLIKRYSRDGVTGVTDSSYNNVNISIATDYDFADTVHHELYHYIERYIFSTGFRFTSWSTLNPGGFTYGAVDYNYAYTKTFSEDAYFVNSYAQSDEYEDRASTFEYMMKPSKASCLNYGKTVWLKARTMSEQIDYFLNSVSPNVTEYWERHIY